MKPLLHCGAIALGSLWLAALPAHAQEGNRPSIYQPPATTSGFELPSVAGTLRWSLSASQRLSFGAGGSNGVHTNLYSTNLSGNVAYLSQSTQHPFSFVYSTGYFYSNQQDGSPFFHNLSVSQVLTVKRWSFIVADNFSFLPQTRVTGLSGIAGLGDLGIDPSLLNQQATGPQSNYANRITNTVSASASRLLTGRTSLSGNVSDTIIRFPTNSQGVETSAISGGGTLSHRIDGRTSINGTYDYSVFSYPQYDLTYKSQGGTINFSRQYSRRLTISAGAGPQYSTSSMASSRLTYALNGNAAYQTANGTYSANFSRAARTGSGVTTASISNDLALFGSRQLDKYSTVSLSLTYDQSTTLPTSTGITLNNTGVIGSAQYSRSISRTLSAYASYSALHQSINGGALAINSFQGLSQTLGFGLTYSPKPINLKSH